MLENMSTFDQKLKLRFKRRDLHDCHKPELTENIVI